MSIWKDRGVPEIKKIAALWLVLGMGFFAPSSKADACSCKWRGPFLIDGADAGRSVTVEEVEEVRRFGRGTLTIDNFALEPGRDGCPKIESMTFSVQIEGGY
jgi:hypothetical protein